jgi:peptidoglycan/LPS O-acetylase OafA/YrhL
MTRPCDIRAFAFLDVLRIVSYLGVLAAHMNQPWFSGRSGLVEIGHECVIVFFVLSGVIVPATQGAKNHGMEVFVCTRLSRLWSVLLPCLLLTVLASFLVNASGLQAPDHADRGHLAIRTLLTAGFSNEIWFLSSGPPINLPVWSISYEFWFYACFAVGVFPITLRRKAVFATVCALIAGPKIVLLFPVWALGWATWIFCKRPSYPQGSSFLSAGLAILFFKLYVSLEANLPNEDITAPLWYSGFFVSDLILGTAVACLLVCIWTLPSDRVPTAGTVGWLRWAGNLTFPLYLVHYPVLVVTATLWPDHRSDSV